MLYNIDRCSYHEVRTKPELEPRDVGRSCSWVSRAVLTKSYNFASLYEESQGGKGPSENSSQSGR